MSTRVLKLSKDQRVEFEGREGIITSNDGAYEVLFDDQISAGRKKTPEIVPFESDISVRPSSKLLPLQVSDDFSNFFNEYVLVLSGRLSLTHSFAHPQHIRR